MTGSCISRQGWKRRDRPEGLSVRIKVLRRRVIPGLSLQAIPHHKIIGIGGSSDDQTEEGICDYAESQGWVLQDS
jgi:hypothetical protein